ncbi:MAG: hypothetical protein KC457_30485 [Myxococcales bacterium]|nr:hypothetical protein [Myxococcales bacterium]
MGVLCDLKLRALVGLPPEPYLTLLLNSARAQLGANDRDFLHLLHLLGCLCLLHWPERGLELLLEELERSQPGPADDDRILVWGHALLASGRISQAVALLRAHADQSPAIARLACRALLRQGDRRAAEDLAADHQLPSLDEIESHPLVEEQQRLLHATLDAFMAGPAPSP